MGGLEAETIPEKADSESQKSLEGRVDVVAATGFFDCAEDLGGLEAGTAPEKADTESTRSLENEDSLGRASDEDALDEVDVVAATGFFGFAEFLEYFIAPFGSFTGFLLGSAFSAFGGFLEISSFLGASWKSLASWSFGSSGSSPDEPHAYITM